MSFFTGGVVPITAAFSLGDPVDPGVVMFQLGLAGKPVAYFYAATNPTMLEVVLRVNTGQYGFAFVPERAGTYLYTWTGKFSDGSDMYFEGQIVVQDRVFAGA